MKRKKLLIGTAIAAIVIVAGGWAAIHFGINLVFDKYVLGTTLSSMAEKDQSKPEQNSEKTSETAAEPKPDEPNGTTAETSQPAVQTNEKLTNTEIINRVLRSSKLTNKMASMVSYDDKRRVISIVLSNFTAEELAEIAKNVKGGISSSYKSQMIAEARGRLTGSQWKECLSIAYKYIDEIRPFVE